MLMYTFMFNFVKDRKDLGQELFLAWTAWYIPKTLSILIRFRLIFLVIWNKFLPCVCIQGLCMDRSFALSTGCSGSMLYYQ